MSNCCRNCNSSSRGYPDFQKVQQGVAFLPKKSEIDKSADSVCTFEKAKCKICTLQTVDNENLLVLIQKSIAELSYVNVQAISML